MFWTSGISPSSVRYASFKGQFLCTKLSTSLDNIQIHTSSFMGRGSFLWNIHTVTTQSPNKTNPGKLWRYLMVHGLTYWRKGNVRNELTFNKDTAEATASELIILICSTKEDLQRTSYWWIILMIFHRTICSFFTFFHSYLFLTLWYIL